MMNPDNKNPCPVDTCGATPGGPCVSAAGKIMKTVHPQRHIGEPRKRIKRPVGEMSERSQFEQSLRRDDRRYVDEEELRKEAQIFLYGDDEL